MCHPAALGRPNSAIIQRSVQTSCFTEVEHLFSGRNAWLMSLSAYVPPRHRLFVPSVFRLSLFVPLFSKSYSSWKGAKTPVCAHLCVFVRIAEEKFFTPNARLTSSSLKQIYA